MSAELQKRIDRNRNLLGLSNSRVGQRPPFEHAREGISAMLEGVRSIVIIPYAQHEMDGPTQRLGKVFKRMGIKGVRSPHQEPGSEENIIADAESDYHDWW